MSKEIKFKKEARSEILKGIDTLANTVKVTLGPLGRNVIIESQFGYPTITKDGVTVAKQIKVKDPLQNIGAQLVKQVAAKTADDAGDGTTTATILAQSIYKYGINAVNDGANPILLKKGIDFAVERIVKSLMDQSKEISSNDDIKKIATISANNDEAIGEMIAKAMDKVGKEGIISVEETQGTETSVSFVEGMKIGTGYLSPYFLTDETTREAVLEKPVVLVYDKTISTLHDLMPLLDQVRSAGRPLLIIANDVDGEALPTLVANKVNGLLRVAAIKVPGFGNDKRDMMEDIATLTGGVLISEASTIKLSEVHLEQLGDADRIVITSDSTTIIKNTTNDLMDERIIALKAQIQKETSKPMENKLKMRLARLTNGVAVIKIGATTPLEMSEKKDRIDDALQATTAAVKEGILPGGGVALIRAYDELEGFLFDNKPVKAHIDIAKGMEIIKESILDPFKCIIDNAGLDDIDNILKMTREANTNTFGFDVKNEKYGDMLEMGVIDPTKVVRLSLENAASIASLLLTTEAVVYESEETRSQANGIQ